MPITLWEAVESIGLDWPDRLIGSILLAAYGLILALILYYYRTNLRRMSLRHWLITANLSFLSLIVSQLFPIYFTFENQLSPLSVAQNPVTTLAPLAAAPYLIAGAFLNPAAALIVGMFTGLGRALSYSHQPFDIFNLAVAAVLASILMQQTYKGRFYQALRLPIVAGILNSVGLIFWVGVGTFAGSDGGASLLAALDLALSTARANFWSLPIEGMIGGAIVMVITLGVPQLRITKNLVPSPLQLSLRNRLLSNFSLFATVMTILLLLVVFIQSVSMSTRLIVNQMAHDAKTVAALVPEFQLQLESVLGQINRYEESLFDDPTESDIVLEQIFQANPFLYRYFILVDREQEIISTFPRDEAVLTLTDQEKLTIEDVIVTAKPTMTTARFDSEDHLFSLVMPLRDSSGDALGFLIGRVPQFSLKNLVVGLDGTVGKGNGFIVDGSNQVIARADTNLPSGKWQPPEFVRPILTETTEPGIAFRGRQGQTNARELVYYVKSEAHPWTVVTKVPYEVVLDMALGISGPLALALMVVMAAFYGQIAVIGRDITTPITELVDATKMITAGGKWTPSNQVHRDDEIGQLNQAFFKMNQSRNKRLNELLLLLGVSHEVSSNVNIHKGMAAILRGTLRGTTAVGARAVVLNPSGGYPLQFGEGPMSQKLAVLDRQVMTRLRHSQELLIMSSKAEIRQGLGLSETADIPIASLIAIPLFSHDRFQGILWLGYQQPHQFDQEERNLLQTLAGQAAVLTENARLYATAEGGRRRLAAVLSSTSDAVIVTDQTNRILLVNRATEQLFNLETDQVSGRPLADIVKVEELVKALTDDKKRTRNLEFSFKSGKTYNANISTISNRDGRAMGRVAVLHDITHFKEIDEMKTEFVRTVSHDLRNPLTFMRGYATMLPMVGEVNEDQQNYIDKIQGGIENMRQLVDNLLDLGRIESGIDLHKEEVPVRTLLMDIATEHWQHARLKGLKIDIEVTPDTPPVVADKLLLRQAIKNLVTNGIKYAPDTDSLKIKAELVDDDMVFSVKDRGPGIPAKDQMRLFEKFYRANQRGEEKIKGIGLGLAIVKSIAERHGGRAWCQSQQGNGSTFYFSLPLNPTGQDGVENGEGQRQP